CVISTAPFNQLGQFALSIDLHAILKRSQACADILSAVDSHSAFGTMTDVAVKSSRRTVAFMIAECPNIICKKCSCNAFTLSTVICLSIPYKWNDMMFLRAEYFMV